MTLFDVDTAPKPGSAPAGATTQSVRRHGRGTALALDLVLIAAAVGIWQWLADGPLASKHLIGSPSGIVRALHAHWGLYERALRTTLWEAARGFWWGNVAALVLAALVAMVPVLERVVLRLALVVFCLPFVAMGPLLRLFFGVGDGPEVTLAGLAVYYTTLVPLLVGLRAVPATWSDLVASYGRGRWTTLTRVRAHACVPYLGAGLQVAVPAAVLGALVGEFTGADRGLGVLTIEALRGLDTDGLWALATLSAVVSVAGYALVGWGARRLSSAHPPLLMAAPPPPSRTTSRARRLLRSTTESLGILVLVLALWSGLIRVFGLSPFIAKGPTDVWRFLVTDPDAAASRSTISAALRQTAQTVLPGYAAGLVLGAGLAALFHLSGSVRRVVTPVTVALRCIPIVAIAPLLVGALGRGVVGTVVVVALMTFFPTLVACSQGLRQAPGQVLDYFDSYAVSSVRVLALAEVPAMMPAFFAAARIAVPSSILAATVAEWLATGRGIGTLMVNSAIESEYDTLWSSIVVLTVLATAGYGLVSVVERIVLSRVAPEQARW